MGEAKVWIGGEFAGEGVPAGLGVGGEAGRRLGEAEVEEFAEPMLITHQVVETAIGFDGEGFLQPFPEWL